MRIILNSFVIIRENCIQYQRMNCQKHRNHHCIHSHNCTNPDHIQKMRRSKQISSNTQKRSQKSLLLSKIAEENEEECQFLYENKNNSEIKQSKKVNKTNDMVPKGQFILLQNKYEKLNEEHRHTEAKLQYYQQQILRIIKCTQTQVNKSITTKIKSEENFIQKIKLLERRLINSDQQIQSLQQLLKTEKKQTCQTKNLLNSLMKEEQKLMKKYTKVRGQKQIYNKESEQYKRESINYLNKYGILKEQFEINNKKQDVLIRKLRNSLQNLENENIKLVRTLKSRQEISSLQVRQKQEIIQELVKRRQKLQKQVDEIKQKYQLSHHKVIELESELEHSKQILQKYLKAQRQKQGILVKQVSLEEKTHFENFTQDKQNQRQNNHDNKIDKFQRENEQLRKEIERLKNEAKNTNNVTNIEEYIMNVGATEAFQKIIKQKNQTIKKLIREKATILKKCECGFTH